MEKYSLNKKSDILALLRQDQKELNYEKSIRNVASEKKLEKIQVELKKMQNWIVENKERVIVIFEGRDAAGKGGAIRRITQHLNPREYNVVALPKPNERERGQWYFQRYISRLPNEGRIIFFDRSWYNRAVVEPVNGFCTDEEYNLFMDQVNHFENMIVSSGIYLIKLYFSISKNEQTKRFEQIKNDPLKRWKYSDVDSKALGLWDEYTKYKQAMYEKTDTKIAPWKIIKANNKMDARINAAKHLLSKIPYQEKT